MSENWVIEVKGPDGVKQFEISDAYVKGYRSAYNLDRFPEVTDYQIALFLIYDRNYHE